MLPAVYRKENDKYKCLNKLFGLSKVHIFRNVIYFYLTRPLPHIRRSLTTSALFFGGLPFPPTTRGAVETLVFCRRSAICRSQLAPAGMENGGLTESEDISSIFLACRWVA